MSFIEYETFILAKPLADTTIAVGSRGVVLMALGGKPETYEVEFPDGEGGNIGMEISYTVTIDQMKREVPPVDTDSCSARRIR